MDRFVIGRKDVGEVAFIGTVDLRGLGLDDIMDIDKGKIQVYGLPGGAERPAIGQGLNKPALLSFRCALLQMPCHGKLQQCDPEYLCQQQHHHQQRGSLGILLRSRGAASTHAVPMRQDARLLRDYGGFDSTRAG